jgi:hypothetical protein
MIYGTTLTAGMLAIALSATVVDINFANAQAARSDGSGVVAGQAQSGEPSTGAGSVQLPSPNSEDQGGTGVKASAQSEGATNKDTAPRDSVPR